MLDCMRPERLWYPAWWIAPSAPRWDPHEEVVHNVDDGGGIVAVDYSRWDAIGGARHGVGL